MTEIRKELERDREYLVSIRREFHQNPELSLQEWRTAQRIEEELDRFGIPHTRVGETGVLGTIRGSGTGSGVVALRADIDALPIQEQSGASYCSRTPGIMHACGHDAHPACLLGAAKFLAAHKEEFGGEVRLIFQPAEEIGRGAKPFVEAGVLDGVDRVLGLHCAPDVPSGKINLKPGLNNAAVDHFCIRVQGKSAHVGKPHLGVDALYIASQIVVALQALVTRMTSPVEPVVIGVGKLNAGTTYNAVAEQAVLEGTTRTVSQESRARIRELLTRTAEEIARVYDGAAAIQWTDIAPPVINDAQACREATAVADQLWGPGTAVADRALSMGGDNFAEYQLLVPGVYAFLGTADPRQPNTTVSLHNGKFDVDENALTMGAGLYAGYAVSWLSGSKEQEKTE